MRITRIYLTMGIVLLLMLIATVAQAQVNPDENQVDFWCETGGVKYEPVDDPFIVPEPPEGKTWTMAVAKAGTTNEVFTPIVVGQEISHSLHDNSHIILCWEDDPGTTTTTSSTTTSTTSTSTTSSTTTSTTTSTLPPSTTTTVPVTTTSSSTSTTTTDPTTTTSSVPTSTTENTTTSTAAATTTTKPKELPMTGVDTTALAAAAIILISIGGMTLAVVRN